MPMANTKTAFLFRPSLDHVVRLGVIGRSQSDQGTPFTTKSILTDASTKDCKYKYLRGRCFSEGFVANGKGKHDPRTTYVNLKNERCGKVTRPRCTQPQCTVASGSVFGQSTPYVAPDRMMTQKHNDLLCLVCLFICSALPCVGGSGGSRPWRDSGSIVVGPPQICNRAQI